MFIPEDLKKPNKFLDVAIPSNRSYFSRLGEVTQMSTQFTGDEVAKMNQDKISQITDYQDYVESLASEQNESN